MEVDESRIRQAVAALLAGKDLLAKAANTKDGPKIRKVLLMPDEKFLSLTIVQKRFARLQYKRLKCPLPHPFRTAGTCDTCFITKDISKEKNFDQDRGTDRFKELLRRGGVEGITEVLTLTQLKGRYKTYEAKRKLLSRYKLFLADERIYGKLAEVLGAKFFVKNRFPVPVDVVGCTDLAGEFGSAIEATYFTNRGKGPQSIMEVASENQSVDEIKDNVHSVLEFLRSRFPGGWENIRSLYLKLGKLSLPIYLDTSSPNFLPVHKEPASTGFTAAAEEVTTVKDAKIRISSAGSIKVMRKKKRSKNSKKKD